MEWDILRILEAQHDGSLKPHFRSAKITSGAILEHRDKTEPDIALLLSGHVSAFLRCGEQEITIFEVRHRFPILLPSGLLLRARRDSELLLAPRAVFLQVMMSTPELYAPLYQALEHLLLQTLRIIEGMRVLNVRERLIRYIIDLSDQLGRTMLDGIAIPFERTVEAIASDVGSSRQTTSQTLNDLIKEGYIRRVSRTQLIVLNMSGLKKALRDTNLGQIARADIVTGPIHGDLIPIFPPRRQHIEDEDALPRPARYSSKR